jgi:hypothetical protein
MFFLNEVPSVNTFYIDEAVKSTPDFVASSTITETLSYIIKWWYISNPDEPYYLPGQSITFSNPIGDIDFCCLITENDTIYNTYDILGFNHHMKILSSDKDQFYRGEREAFEYSGYSNYNTHIGIRHKNDFKDDGISGYSGYSGVCIPVMDILDSENIRIQLSYNEALKDENLNPIYDDEQDSFNLFSGYGLDPTNYNDQETFNKLQQYEQENFTLYNKKSSMLRILKPIDDFMTRMYNRITELEKQIEIKIIDYFIAGENIQKHQLITLFDTNVGEENETKIFRANAFTIYENGETTIVRRCYGIALEDCNEGEICKFQTQGRITEFNFWWGENYTFVNDINKLFYLWEYGRMDITIPNVDNISFEGEDKYIAPVLYQEIGYPLAENEFMVNIKQPVLQNIIENCDESGGDSGGEEIPT